MALRDRSVSTPLLVAIAMAPLLLADAALAAPPAWLGLAAAAALVVAVLAAGHAVARRLLPPGAPTPSRATATAVAATLLLTLPATLLGHLGLLHPPLFLALEALLTLTLTVALTRPSSLGQRPASATATAGDRPTPATGGQAGGGGAPGGGSGPGGGAPAGGRSASVGLWRGALHSSASARHRSLGRRGLALCARRSPRPEPLPPGASPAVG